MPYLRAFAIWLLVAASISVASAPLLSLPAEASSESSGK